MHIEIPSIRFSWLFDFVDLPANVGVSGCLHQLQECFPANSCCVITTAVRHYHNFDRFDFLVSFRLFKYALLEQRVQCGANLSSFVIRKYANTYLQFLTSPLLNVFLLLMRDRAHIPRHNDEIAEVFILLLTVVNQDV